MTVAIILGASTTTNEFNYSSRYGVTFNTSSLEDNATIAVAKLQLWGDSNAVNGLGSNWGLVVTSFTPADPRNYNISDYDNTSDYELSNEYYQGSFTKGYYRNLTLNAAGIANISKTGDSTFYVRTTYDTKGFNGTWANGGKSYQIVQTYSHPPKLYVEWYVPSIPVSNFTANQTTGQYPASVAFTDTSTGYPSSWNWTFGDGNTSTLQNPTHTYAAIGNYTVTHGVSNALGSDIETKTDYITVTPKQPIADFSGNPTLGTNPTVVTFTDTSQFTPTSWLWDFGDGDTTDNDHQNPVHTYSSTGHFTVKLNATNAYGTSQKIETSYIYITGEATRGDHPYLFFHNITELSGFQNRTVSPWSEYEAAITADATASGGVVSNALQYHICSNSGGTGCSVFANRTVDKLINTANDYASGRDGAIAYDLIADTNNTGQTSLNTTTDGLIRDRLAYVANYQYMRVPNEPTDVDYVDRNAKLIPCVWIMGEVLYDYDTSGKGLSSTPAQWIAIGTDEFFDDNTVITPTPDPGGFLYWQYNKTGGMGTAGGYVTYYASYYRYIPKIYSRIYGNIFNNKPAFKNVYMAWLYSSYPNNLFNNYETAGQMGLIFTSTGLDYMPQKERSWLLWQIQNTTQMYQAHVLVNEGHWYGPSNTLQYLTYSNHSTEDLYKPVHKNWMTPTYVTMRTAWNEMADMISISSKMISPVDNRVKLHADQLAIDVFAHGDNVLPDGGEVKSLSGTFYHEEDMAHNILMFNNPRTAFDVGSHTNATVKGSGPQDSTTSGGRFTNFVDSEAMGYMKGWIPINTVQDADPRFANSLGSTIYWSREIIAPKNEYYVVVDRADSPLTWLYKSHWTFGSNRGTFGASTATAKVTGDLVIGDTPYDWFALPYKTETNTSIKTNKIIWNTTNEREQAISTELFSAPQSFVTAYRFATRVGGYTGATTSSNHEFTNPHIFFDTPESTNTYRVTAILPSFASDTAVRTPAELSVTGTGSAIRVNASTGTKADYFYTGSGTNNFSTFQTDADTAFIRKSNSATVEGYLVVNGTLLNDGAKVFNSSTKLNYISVNRTGNGLGGKFNVSGSGVTVLRFFNVQQVRNMTRDNQTFSDWVMEDSNTTLKVNTTLSDHFFEYGDILEGYPDEGLGEFLASGISLDIPAEEEFSGSPIANFTADPLSGQVPLDVAFSDQSVNGTAYLWNFDGTNTSDNIGDTEWIFETPGIYNVVLNVTNNAGSDEHSETITVTNASAVANFTASNTTGGSPLDVTFTDTSSGTPINWDWYWSADEIKDSDAQNPSNSFMAGTYNIRLYASNDGGGSWKNVTGMIVVSQPDQPVANFTANQTSGLFPLAVQFTDSTANSPTAWNWTFGDGNYSSEQNPVHIYVTNGAYTVSLNSSNVRGFDISTKTDYITANTPPPPDAQFSANITTICMNGTVQFTDLSTGSPTSWFWDFGDGTNTTLQSPAHRYSIPFEGSATVKHRATNAYGSDWLNSTYFIAVQNCTGTTVRSQRLSLAGGTVQGSLSLLALAPLTLGAILIYLAFKSKGARSGLFLMLGVASVIAGIIMIIVALMIVGGLSGMVEV